MPASTLGTHAAHAESYHNSIIITGRVRCLHGASRASISASNAVTTELAASQRLKQETKEAAFAQSPISRRALQQECWHPGQRAGNVSPPIHQREVHPFSLTASELSPSCCSPHQCDSHSLLPECLYRNSRELVIARQRSYIWPNGQSLGMELYERGGGGGGDA